MKDLDRGERYILNNTTECQRRQILDWLELNYYYRYSRESGNLKKHEVIYYAMDECPSHSSWIVGNQDVTCATELFE